MVKARKTIPGHNVLYFLI
jgi:large subunit ribosomal protein L18Ae